MPILSLSLFHTAITTSQETDGQDDGIEVPMNLPTKTVRRTVSLTAIPTVLAMLLTVAPPAAAQSRTCQAKVQEWIEECEAQEAEDKAAGRSGLGWTGIGLASAGAGVLAQGLTVSRWRNCGPGNQHHCRNIEGAYRIGGGTMLATGLVFLVIDETRRTNARERLAPRRQMALAVGPRAVHVQMQW
jgi:hypothetical protein